MDTHVLKSSQGIDYLSGRDNTKLAYDNIFIVVPL